MAQVTEEAVQNIYRATIDEHYATVARKCAGDRALAEDVVQETWMRAVRAWRRDGLPVSPIAWLTTVSRNLLLNEFRRRKPIPLQDVSASDIPSAYDSDDDSGASEANAAGVVQRALSRLPRSYAYLIRTFHVEGHRTASIARTLGISERAVEGRLYRARESLRNELMTEHRSSEDV